MLTTETTNTLIHVLCLSLTACGGSAGTSGHRGESLGVTVDGDWRDSGVVVDSGTITHEGEGSANVLVTVDENSTAFYWANRNRSCLTAGPSP